MPDNLGVYNTEEAAAYCGMKYEQFRGYVRKGRVKPDLVKPRMSFFRQETLDTFKAEPRRKSGRQPKQVACPHCGCSFPLRPPGQET
jgi:hypothetical protein